jgi:hypothetical protein
LNGSYELDRVFDAGGSEVRHALTFRAETEVEGEVRERSPGVLDEERRVARSRFADRRDVQQAENTVLPDRRHSGARRGVRHARVVQDAVGVVPRAHIVGDGLALQTSLELVLAPGVHEVGDIRADEVANVLVERRGISDEHVGRIAAGAGQPGRDRRQPLCGAARRDVVDDARELDAGAFPVGQEAAGASGERQTGRGDVVDRAGEGLTTPLLTAHVLRG